MRAGNAIKLRNCHFISKSICYLSQANATGKMLVAQKTTDVFKALKCQTSTSKAQSFQELRNVNTRFVPSFARLTAFFNDKIRKENPSRFELDTVKHEVVEILKKKLIRLPELALQQRSGK